jgi:hypothetical protein
MQAFLLQAFTAVAVPLIATLQPRLSQSKKMVAGSMVAIILPVVIVQRNL